MYRGGVYGKCPLFQEGSNIFPRVLIEWHFLSWTSLWPSNFQVQTPDFLADWALIPINWAHNLISYAQQPQPHSDMQEKSCLSINLLWTPNPHPSRWRKCNLSNYLQRYCWPSYCQDVHCCSPSDHQEWSLWLLWCMGLRSLRCYDPASLSTPSSHFPPKPCTFSGSDISPAPASEKLLKKPLTSIRPFLSQLSRTPNISLAFLEGGKNH